MPLIAHTLGARQENPRDAASRDNLITVGRGSNPAFSDDQALSLTAKWGDQAVVGPIGGGDDGTGRVAEAQPNPGSGGRSHSRSILADLAVRRLMPVECERLQGFPDGWTEGFSDSTRYRMLGNAVCVNVSEWIGRRILEVDA